MIRLSRLADYGVVLTTYLARHPSGWQTAAELSTAAALPTPTVAKILKRLAQEGVLESHRGTKGGYALARPAREISVADIVKALDGPIALTECMGSETGSCEIESLCPTRINWRTINDAITDALKSVSIADMAAPTFPILRPPKVESWQRV